MSVVPVNQKANVRVRVMTKDGRVFDLGSPESIFFPLRRWWYLMRRRNELKGVSNG